MKLKAAFSKFLTNKLVLNVISIIAFFNVIGFIVMDQLNSVIYFILLALIVTYFSKNMIIVLGVPLILVNLFAPKTTHHIEGLENNDNNNKNPTQTEVINKINTDKKKQGSATLPGTIDSTVNSETASDENFEVGRNKRKGGGYDIDYASTVEDAYDELNKILGSDGIKRLTDDTQNLMKQQLQLAESMKSMTPIIQGMGPMLQQAQGILGGMGDGKEGLGNLLEIAKKFTGGMNK
jgi:hypothetical protein